MTKRNINPKTRQVPIVRKIAGNQRWPKTLVLETIAWATVDYCDFEEVGQLRWYLDGGYARTGQYPGQSRMFLHWLIFLRKQGSLPIYPNQIDHIDRNPLNCTRENLREASRSLQKANTGLRKDNTSGYRGVSWNAKGQKWAARAMLNGKSRFLGSFRDKHEAARAVNEFFATHHPESPIPNPGAELDQGEFGS